jgi:capsule biosynthesis phosphatase
MNIIIPASGIGQRFLDDGYLLPKPLISVLGEPMIVQVIKHLKLTKEDKVYIIYLQEFNQYQFVPIIKRALPEINIEFIQLNYHTRGPAETILCGLNQIADLDGSFVSVDYDMLFTDTIKHADGNYICYFETENEPPIYSYIKHLPNWVTDIKEKEKISNSACAGAYGFESGHLLKKYCERVLDKGEKSNGEFYISNVYAEMLKDELFVLAKKVEAFDCVGTPQQLKAYCMAHTQEKKRFCFDLDNTLVTYPEIPGDYKTVKPITKNIKLVQYLHKQGHTIIIQTARKMKSALNNVGVATMMAHLQVYDTLDEFKIPYDELHFGKPQADFYIDDLSVKPWSIEKETGFYNGQIEARSFNSITIKGDVVCKQTNNSGEIYWYQNITTGLEKHFAEDISIQDNRITMSKIKGVNFSYLLVNGSLTKLNLLSLLGTLHKVHNCRMFQTEIIIGSDINYNYGPKIMKRYKEYDYELLFEDAGEYLPIVSEISHIPQIGVIHGDPVFSNIFLCENQLIKFIDMRGRIGEVNTIYGDIFYDYAKVYQSLCGYDYILNDVEINHAYLKDLREYFLNWYYSRFTVDLNRITAGLLFSLIPLHDDPEKQKKYYNLCTSLCETILQK